MGTLSYSLFHRSPHRNSTRWARICRTFRGRYNGWGTCCSCPCCTRYSPPCCSIPHRRCTRHSPSDGRSSSCRGHYMDTVACTRHHSNLWHTPYTHPRPRILPRGQQNTSTSRPLWCLRCMSRGQNRVRTPQSPLSAFLDTSLDSLHRSIRLHTRGTSLLHPKSRARCHESTGTGTAAPRPSILQCDLNKTHARTVGSAPAASSSV